jgi:hypothetical protein
MRLTNRTISPMGAPVTIHFRGEAIPALSGETVAAALSAAGHLTFRRTPSGAPRGLHCGMGACFDCVVAIDGRGGQRACMTSVADAMRVEDDAGGAALTPPPEGSAAEEAAPDVLVVGAGPAGLSAATAAAEAGASVIVLDERSAAGGQYAKPLAPSHRDAMPDAQALTGHALRARAAAARVTIHQKATVWGGFAADEVAAGW